MHCFLAVYSSLEAIVTKNTNPKIYFSNNHEHAQQDEECSLVTAFLTYLGSFSITVSYYIYHLLSGADLHQAPWSDH